MKLFAVLYYGKLPSFDFSAGISFLRGAYSPADVSLIRITFLINPSGLARDYRTTVWYNAAYNAKFIHGIYVLTYIHGKRSAKNTEERGRNRIGRNHERALRFSIPPWPSAFPFFPHPARPRPHLLSLSRGCSDSRQFLLKHRTVDPAFSRPLGLSLGLIPLFVPRCYKPLQSMFSSHLSYSDSALTASSASFLRYSIFLPLSEFTYFFLALSLFLCFFQAS